jgi:hypothetical protein
LKILAAQINTFALPTVLKLNLKLDILKITKPYAASFKRWGINISKIKRKS